MDERALHLHRRRTAVRSAAATEPDPRTGDRRSECRNSADAHDAINRTRQRMDKQVEEPAVSIAPHPHGSRPVTPPLQQPPRPPWPPPHRQLSQWAESERRDAEPPEAASLHLEHELLQFHLALSAMDAWLDRITKLVRDAAPAASQKQREPSRAHQPSHDQEQLRGGAPPSTQWGNLAGCLSTMPSPLPPQPRENPVGRDRKSVV